MGQKTGPILLEYRECCCSATDAVWRQRRKYTCARYGLSVLRSMLQEMELLATETPVALELLWMVIERHYTKGRGVYYESTARDTAWDSDTQLTEPRDEFGTRPGSGHEAVLPKLQKGDEVPKRLTPYHRLLTARAYNTGGGYFWFLLEKALMTRMKCW